MICQLLYVGFVDVSTLISQLSQKMSAKQTADAKDEIDNRIILDICYPSSYTEVTNQIQKARGAFAENDQWVRTLTT